MGVGVYVVAWWRSARALVDGIDTSYLVIAVLAVQTGDVVTTYVGVFGAGLGEANPFMAVVLNRTGILGLVAVKCCWFVVAMAGASLARNSRRILKYCLLAYLLIGGPALASNVAVIAAFLL